MNFDDFIRRWGKEAPYQIAPDWTISLFANGHEDATSTLMAIEFESLESHSRNGRVARKQRMTMRVKVNERSSKWWTIEDDNLFLAKDMQGKTPEKFAWNPVTGEFIFCSRGQNHAAAISAYGKSPFDDYVRGIITGGKVYTRPFWPTWARDSVYDSFDEDASVISYDAQYQAKEALGRYGGSKFTWQFNISNKGLEQQTGLHRW